MLTLGSALPPPCIVTTVPSLHLPLNAVPLAPLIDAERPPLLSDPPRFRNEVTLPVPAEYPWPKVGHFAFYDHTGHFPRAWSELGFPGISVADRRASQQPPHDWLHVIGDVRNFVEAYPYPIGLQTNSVTCTNTNLASKATWHTKLENGSMLRSAEEFLWINHIGVRSAGEQPPTVLETLIGPPSFATNATQHFAARDKTWNVWLRDLPAVPSGRQTPPHLVRARRGASSSEQRMLVRTETELQLARDFAAAWNRPFDEPPHRPAAEPHPDYEANLASLRHNYGVFKAKYAPRATAHELALREHHSRYVIGVPLAWSHGHVALTHLADGSIFAVPYREGETIEAHYAELTRMLPCDSHPHLLCTTTVAEHYICALPCSAPPLAVLRTTAQARSVAESHCPVAWCSVEALQGTPQLLYVATVTAQLEAATPGATLRTERVGAWHAPRPVVPQRASDAWERAAPSKQAHDEWATFLDTERSRAAEIAAAFAAAGPDAQPFTTVIVSAATYAAELPVPEQGLPSFADPRLLLVPTPPPPMPLCTAYLAEVPAQAVPPGYENALLPLRALVKRWPRVELARTYTRQASYDHDCRLNGGVSELKRPGFAAYGDGAFVSLPHADGVGSFLANIIIWERTDRGYRPMDLTEAIRDHKTREVLMRVIGATTDQELLYFCLHGVRWLKFEAPRQLRFGRNVQSLGPRVAKVGHATAKLIRAGLYGATKLIKAPPAGAPVAPLDPDLDNFLTFVPCYDMGCGGQDKADNPDEARKTGNTSDPQPGKGETTREARAEDRHAHPGVPVISFNDLTGPRKMTPAYDGPPPSFPDPETKSRPRHLSAGAAYLSHLAHISGDYVVGVKDDIRWFFWQFYLHRSQLWLSVEHLWVPFEAEVDGVATTEWWFCGITPYVMNMGTRPASKIACRFSEIFQAEWRTRMRAEVVPRWLARQSPKVLAALERRRAALGDAEADPFKGWLYTDDFTMFFIGAWLAASGAALWRSMMNEANIWMSKKVGAGTVIDSHGGRFVLNGGFTCLTPSKRARGIATAHTALANGITVDELVATNSYFVHVDDIINLLPNTLKGAWAPVKAQPVGSSVVVLSEERWPRPRAAYLSVIAQLQRRAAASFLCAVTDAHVADPWTGCGVPFVTSTSDACSSPARGLPGVVGWLDGQYWHFPLTGEWQRRHITVTEALGYAGNVIIFGQAVGDMQHLIKGDATGGLAMLMGTTGTNDLRYMRERLERTQEWQHVSHTLWAQHLAGAANIFADLGSRNEWDTLARVAAAYGVRLREVPLPPAFLDYAADVLANTTLYVPPAKRTRSSSADPFVPVNKYAYGVEAIEFMQQCPCTPPMLPRAAAARAHTHAEPLQSHARTPPMLPPSPSLRTPSASRCPAGAEWQPLTPPMLPRASDAPAAHTAHSAPGAHAHASARLDAQWRTQQQQQRGSGPPPLRARSPQPRTAQEARRAAALTTANALANDDTEYAICPDDPGRIKTLCVDAAAARNAAIPAGTRGSDAWGFNWVVRFCLEHNTPWMRPRVVATEWHEREAYLVALALLWISIHMPPSAKRRARGYDEAMPDSALNAIYGWRRVLRDCGRHLAPMALALAQCRGVRLQYTKSWGNDSLVPQKHRPIPRALVLAIIRTLANYAVPGWSRPLHDMWRRLVKYELVTGTRGNEVAGEDTRLSRADFAPVIDGIVSEPTPENYKRMRPGDKLRGKSSPSKCDRTNATWGAKDMWFELDPDSEFNFAYEWVKYELEHPCLPALRRTTPAFSPSCDATPLTSPLLHTQHKALLKAADPTAVHTFHDWRARLAQALVNANQPDGVIQAALRWKSPQSIQAYAGLPPSVYARMVEDAAECDAATPSTRTIPTYDPSEACANMDETIRALERDLGARKAKQAAQPRAAAPPPAQPDAQPARQPPKRKPPPNAATPPAPKRRTAAAQPPAAAHGAATPAPKRRGRPPTQTATPQTPAKRRGRPPKAGTQAAATNKRRVHMPSGTTAPTAAPTPEQPKAPATPRPSNRPASLSRARPTPRASRTFELGDGNTIDADTDSGHPALGKTLTLPTALWRRADAPSVPPKWEVVAWAHTLQKYIVRSLDDGSNYTVPMGMVHRQLHVQRGTSNK